MDSPQQSVIHSNNQSIDIAYAMLNRGVAVNNLAMIAIAQYMIDMLESQAINNNTQ